MNNANPKICEVIDSWPPHSFIHRHVSSMAIPGETLFPIALRDANDSITSNSLQGLGEETTVSILPPFRHPIPFSLLPGIQPFLTSPLGIWLKNWRMKQKLFPAFKKIRPDLIHFHWIDLAILLRWIPKTLGIPYTVSLRGSEVRLLTPASVEKTEQIKTILEHAAGIHSVSHGLGRDLEYYPFGEVPCTTIYTCMPCPNFLPPYPNIEKGPVHLLTVGNLVWQKGYSHLLLALKRLKENHFPWKLTMAGYGPDEDRIRYWINQFGLQSHIQLLGKVNQSKVQELYRTHHAYVQSSISEGLSNSLAEAMANGCPVFATKVGGTAEVIQDGKNGFLLAPLKPETWIEQLNCIKDSSFMRKIREVAYDTAKKMFSAENHANQFKAFYDNAITTYQSRLHGVSKKFSVTNHIPGRKGVPSENVKKILVLGNWEWPIGVDGVIRVIGEIIHKEPHALLFKVVGYGSQKTELQYLCNSMHILQNVELVEVEKDNEDQIKKIQKEWSDLIIHCHRHGEITLTNSETRLEVKNLEELERALLSSMEANQKISPTTKVGFTKTQQQLVPKTKERS